MAGTRKIVVAGYGPWAMTSVNPAGQTVEQMEKRSWPGCQLIPLIVPVRTAELPALIEKTLLEHRPDAWLGIGVYPTTMSIRMEAVGINCRDFVVPDNDGTQPEGIPVIEGGPVGRFTTLPSRAIVAAMRQAGIPAELSYSAGTHMCNQMIYTTLHLIERHGLETLCGFMHVPHSSAYVAERQEKEGLQPSLPLSTMADAGSICIELTLDALSGRERSSAKADARIRETA